ncbi:PAS domain-containing protein [Candidatus Saccharibacteria bacterium]|nr:PAS domain-containing protein [Candidatus Saccharibacteria bacterium]
MIPETDQDRQNLINLEHAQLRALINSMADGVIATDEQGRIMSYNGAALNVLDSNSALEGGYIGNTLKLFDETDQPIDGTRLVLETKTQTISRDYRLHYSDNSIVNIYLSIAPVHPSYGSDSQGGFVLLVRDITHEKSLEEERDEFISVVSHELRTPVTIAEGNLSNATLVIDKGGDASAITSAVHQAHDQILFLSSLINDLSTLSRAENGTLDVNIVSINVHQLLTNLSDNYRPSVEKKNLSLQVNIDPSLELLHSSSLYVREILQNFITNAIKYTESGTITIGAKPAGNGVNFTITDTGIGISKNDQEQIFNKFFRSEDFRTRKNSGTGLGLYVTRKLAKLINAEIKLDSVLDRGSTFTIFIPNQNNNAAPAEKN